ncbi:biotin synthase [Ophiostoma piceae UAMH 11346]|uniref:biotin synthase n=1 Tax=Ophiostoma piceae (strain UAMH 11346) TaxID=1262450 RepID=S3D090_OPHP1|nr:biotin synthase [Ophiostoma piceae UAMH 11346]
MLWKTNRALVGRQAISSSASFLRRAYSATAVDDVASAASTNSLVFRQALQASGPRTNWTREEIAAIYSAPLMDLAYAAGTVHRRFHNPGAIQMCTLMNIKTGGCSEDCSYCAQSSRYQTGLKATKLSPVDAVLAAAKVARDNGSTRFCMGAAWRDMRGRKSGLRNIKAMVEGVHALGLESCVTLGMLDDTQAKELKEAGLTAYNHNVDTSREHYPKVITTRSYDERLETISNVRDAGIKVCTGGILGLGESAEDHVGLLHTVSTMPAHPESFPVNTLVPIEGTPLFKTTRIKFDAVLRTIATARMIMPTAIIRLAAGRVDMTEEKQVLCFMAGANAVFTGEKMLTTACSGWEEDLAMFKRWGLFPMKAYVEPKLRDVSDTVETESKTKDAVMASVSFGQAATV